MKKLITPLFLILATTSFGQWQSSVNAGANPARNLPYKAIHPWNDLVLGESEFVQGNQLNFQTQKMEKTGEQNYIKDANGNYTTMFQGTFNGTKLDTVFLLSASINYNGIKPNTYRIASYSNGSLNSIRNAVATWNANGYDVVNYTDSNFISGIKPVTHAKDSFVYNGAGKISEFYESMDTGNGSYYLKRYRFTYANSRVTEHYTDQFDGSAWSNKDLITLSYDGNGFIDSLQEFSWDKINSKWFVGDGVDYDYNGSGLLTSYITLNDDGSGGRDLDDKIEIAYNANNTLKQLDYYAHDGTKWNLDASRKATYNAAGDTLLKIVQPFPTVPTIIMFEWLFTTKTAPPAAAPAAPSGLSGVVATRAASDKAITLTWTDNSNNEDGFTVERKKTGGSFTTVGAVLMDVTTYKDTTTLEENTDYVYRVMATKVGAGSSAPSNEFSITMPANGPLSLSSVSNGALKVYPNPARDFINIWGLKNGQYRIIDLLGNEKVASTAFTGNTQIATQELNAGFYVIQIDSNEGVSFKQIQILK